MKNWKTTLAGAAGFLLIILDAAVSQHPVTWRDWGKAIAVGAVGVLAKDHNS